MARAMRVITGAILAVKKLAMSITDAAFRYKYPPY